MPLQPPTPGFDGTGSRHVERDALSEDTLRDRRLEALERDNKHLREVLRGQEHALRVVAKVLAHVTRAGNGR